MWFFDSFQLMSSNCRLKISQFLVFDTAEFKSFEPMPWHRFLGNITQPFWYLTVNVNTTGHKYFVFIFFTGSRIMDRLDDETKKNHLRSDSFWHRRKLFFIIFDWLHMDSCPARLRIILSTQLYDIEVPIRNWERGFERVRNTWVTHILTRMEGSKIVEHGVPPGTNAEVDGVVDNASHGCFYLSDTFDLDHFTAFGDVCMLDKCRVIDLVVPGNIVTFEVHILNFHEVCIVDWMVTIWIRWHLLH